METDETMKPNASIDTKFVGQDFDAFLQEEGIALEVEAKAIKKVLAALVAGPTAAHQPHPGTPPA